MKIEFPKGPKEHKRVIKAEPLSKIFENRKSMLKRSMEVIKISALENFERVFQDYIAWRTNKAKKPDYLFNMITDIAFVSILPTLVKRNKELFEKYRPQFNEIISSAVSELGRKKIPKSDNMVAIYSSIYEKLNEKRIKKIFNLDIAGIDWKTALTLSILSHGSPKHSTLQVLRCLYSKIKTKNPSDIKKLFKRLWDKQDMPKVATYILLEKAYDAKRFSYIDKELYSAITNIALEKIESRHRDDIKVLLKLYCQERRSQETDTGCEFIYRRVNFSTLNEEDYQKIVDVAKSLGKKNEMYRIFLDMTRVPTSKKSKSSETKPDWKSKK